MNPEAPSRPPVAPDRPSGKIRLPLQALVLAAAAAILSIAANQVREEPFPWSQEWSKRVESAAQLQGFRTAEVQEAQSIVEAGTWFVFDARSPDYFEAGHLPAAMSLPRDTFDEVFLEVGGMLVPEQSIMVYCSGAACDESLDVCTYLEAQGFTNLVLFTGGYDTWTEAGLPTESGL